MLNEVLGVAARFQQHLTRKFGIVGGSPSPQLTPEIAPTVTLESGPEAHILQSEYLASGFMQVAAVAAKRSACALFNPAGSNVVLVVTQMSVGCGTTTTVAAGIMKNAVAYPTSPAAGGVTFRDTRVPVDPAGSTATKPPVGQLRSDNEPPTLPASNLFQRAFLANTQVTYNEPVVLAPGWAVGMYIATVNLAGNFEFSWHEIPLAQGEVGPF